MYHPSHMILPLSSHQNRPLYILNKKNKDSDASIVIVLIVYQYLHACRILTDSHTTLMLQLLEILQHPKLGQDQNALFVFNFLHV